MRFQFNRIYIFQIDLYFERKRNRDKDRRTITTQIFTIMLVVTISTQITRLSNALLFSLAPPPLLLRTPPSPPPASPPSAECSPLEGRSSQYSVITCAPIRMMAVGEGHADIRRKNTNMILSTPERKKLKNNFQNSTAVMKTQRRWKGVHSTQEDSEPPLTAFLPHPGSGRWPWPVKHHYFKLALKTI